MWTAPAVEDLEAVRVYIARDSQVYADSTVLSILKAVEKLQTFPHSGRVVPELADPETREVLVGSYRILYDTAGSVLRVLSVLHAARQFPCS